MYNPMNEIIADILQNLFGVSREQCTDALNAKDVEGWDSVNHITFVLALEGAMGIQFSPEEIPQLISVEKIKAILAKHGKT
jgi:acyl carrier protein